MGYFKIWTSEDIRVFRAKQRWTQSELGYLLFGKFSNSTISSLENEVNPITRLHCLGLDTIERRIDEGFDFSPILEEVKEASKKEAKSEDG